MSTASALPAASTESRVLAIDVGSSAVKVGVVDADGLCEPPVVRPVSTSTPFDRAVEQDPTEWWTATVAAIEAIAPGLRATVGVVSVTGQMQDLLCLDTEGVAVGPVILYSDVRADRETAELVAELHESGHDWGAAIGGPPDATHLLGKWRWLERHRPEQSDRTDHVVLGGGAEIVRRLVGRPLTDHTTAATTGLYDVRVGEWWPPAVERFGPRLPTLDRGAPHPIRAEMATVLSLPPDTSIVLAPGDAVATTLGVVGERTGVPYASLGTSGWVAVAESTTGGARPVDGADPADPSAEGTDAADGAPSAIRLPGLGADHGIAVEPLLSVGSAIDWLRTDVLGGVDHDGFERLAGTGCAAEHGVVAVAHLDGTRAQPTARAAFIGLTRTTDRAVLAAALLEALASLLAEISGRLAPDAEEMVVVGGASRSDSLCQSIADAVGRPVRRTRAVHASLIGAAVAAGVDPAGSPDDRVFSPRTERRDALARVRRLRARAEAATAEIDAELAELAEIAASSAGNSPDRTPCSAEPTDPDRPGDQPGDDDLRSPVADSVNHS